MTGDAIASTISYPAKFEHAVVMNHPMGQAAAVSLGRLCLGGRAHTLERTQAVDRFLAGIEQRAFRIASIATGDEDEALDVVQVAMLKLVQRYSACDESE